MAVWLVANLALSLFKGAVWRLVFGNVGFYVVRTNALYGAAVWLRQGFI